MEAVCALPGSYLDDIFFLSRAASFLAFDDNVRKRQRSFAVPKPHRRHTNETILHSDCFTYEARGDSGATSRLNAKKALVSVETKSTTVSIGNIRESFVLAK